MKVWLEISTPVSTIFCFPEPNTPVFKAKIA